MSTNPFDLLVKFTDAAALGHGAVMGLRLLLKDIQAASEPGSPTFDLASNGIALADEWIASLDDMAKEIKPLLEDLS